MFNGVSQPWYRRRLRFEPLESRQMLSITVNTLTDENDGVGVGTGTSLREAIGAAAPGDTIDFSVTGTIVTTGLTINKNLMISGPGASLLTIQAFDLHPETQGNGTRPFTITDNNTTNLLNVSISGLTLTGGDVNNGGGAILTKENLVVSDCVIKNNVTTGAGYLNAGGAILSDPGQNVTVFNSLTLRNCVISGNTATLAEGGAIRKRYGTLVIEDCTITGNSAYYGGGISAADNSVQVQINRSTISNNRATYVNGYGGGMFVRDATVTVIASTISGNTAPMGGGIDTTLARVTLTDSNVTGNSATGGGVGNYGGGGIAADRYGLWITRCTISGNTSTRRGGGIDAAYVSIVDSTISGNSAPTGGGVYVGPGGGKIVGSTFSGNTASSRGAAIDGRTLPISFSTITANTSPVNSPGAVRVGTLLSCIVAGNINGDVNGAGTLGYNLVGTGGTFNKPGDQSGVTNPMLGPLADNGGPTKTHAPLPGSPAINSGNPTFDPANPDGILGTPDDPLPLDQRGAPFNRVYGGRIDKGAVESQPIPAAVMGDYDQNGVVDTGDYLIWQKARGATGVTPYTGADGTGDGVVDQSDLKLWRYHFGSTVPVVAAGSGNSEQGLVAFGTADGAAGGVAEALAEPVAPVAQRERMALPAEVAPSARRSTAGLKPIKPHAVAMLRDDALLAWVESSARVSGRKTIGFEAMEQHSDDTSVAHSCDALDTAVGELTDALLGPRRF